MIRNAEVISFPEFNLVRVTPQNPGRHPVPVVVGPGFGTNSEAYALLINQLAERDHTVLCPDVIVGREPMILGKIPRVIQAKRDALRNTIEYVAKPVDAIVHSQYAIVSILEARKYPDYFRNMVLNAPGGIHPGRGFLATLSNLVEGDRRNHKDKAQLELEAEEVTADLIKINDQIGRRYRKSRMRLVLETLTSASVTIDQHLPYLQYSGVQIVIAAQEKDAYFPPHYLNPSGSRIWGVEKFEVLPGIHGAMKFIPESAQAIVDILESMESR